MGVRLLRHRPGRLRPPPDRRRDRRAGGRGPAEPRTARPTGVERRVHGHGRAAGQLRPHVGRRRAPARRHGHLGPPPHGVDRRHRPRHPPAGRPRTCRSTWPSRCTPPTTSCATELVPDQPALPAGRAGRAPAPTTCAAKGRRLSFEWALIDGVNDRADRRPPSWPPSPGPCGAHVNLIPLNPTPGFPTPGTPPERVRAFRDAPRALGVNATVRHNRGTDIDAACGQLRALQTTVTVRRRTTPALPD